MPSLLWTGPVLSGGGGYAESALDRELGFHRAQTHRLQIQTAAGRASVGGASPGTNEVPRRLSFSL